jgi:hypothetical protein
MATVPKINAVYTQLFGTNPVRSPEDWDTLMRRLVYLKLAKADEITTIDATSLIYPLTLENTKNIIKNKFGSQTLAEAISDNSENLIRLKELRELVVRWQRHSLSNEEIVTLIQMKEKFAQNLNRQKELMNQSSQTLAKFSEPLIQVKELIYSSGNVKTSFDYVRYLNQRKQGPNRAGIFQLPSQGYPLPEPKASHS